MGAGSRKQRLERIWDFLTTGKFKLVVLIVWVLVALVAKTAFYNVVEKEEFASRQKKIDAMAVGSTELTMMEYYDTHYSPLLLDEKLKFWNKTWVQSSLFVPITLPVVVYVMFALSVSFLRGREL